MTGVIPPLLPMTTSRLDNNQATSQPGIVPRHEKEARMSAKRIVPLLVGLLLWPGAVRSEESDGAWPPDVVDVLPASAWETPPPPPDCLCCPDTHAAPDWCAPERFSVQVLTGYYATCIGPGAAFDPARPSFQGHTPCDFADLNVRLGYRPSLPASDEPYRLRDRFELLLDFEAGAVTHGLGNYVVGPILLLRSDLVDPDRRLVPYIQGGAGLAFTDGYKDPHQRALGQWQEFFLQGMAGLHCRLSDCWSLDVEGGWQHVSNACLASRNAGVNNLGGSLGFTYIFAPRQHETH
jgi:hypothetical protein